ncbi:phosphate ABC transporter permease [Ehrlichia ruminantium]|uniref:Phosphate ABC transporter permease n=1 Tax=Ehrlichia ruminantium TaxID=779 RepID=A0A170T1A6_EHRRU|nr:PstA family ABC transporter permease [Ehrlichia ruminantium]GAT75406.1 phosphate ABC transporter permease [Ehrlichia ruminantium]GAT78518.1 phosphate ABC transporter permease [Ehrlichia ruminantium]
MHIQKKLGKLLKYRHIASRVSLKNRKDRILSILSMSALISSLGILFLILGSIINNGYNALTATEILLPITINKSTTADNMALRGILIDSIHKSLETLFSDVVDISDPNNKNTIYSIISDTAHHNLADFIYKNPETTTFKMWFKSSTTFNRIIKQKNTYNKVYSAIITKLQNENLIKQSFNNALFIKYNSRSPESSGIIGSLIGSIFSIIICLIFAVPIGITSGICLNELIPKNRISYIIEVSITNLAAVPSIIFGILGLAIYINIFKIPRSSSFIGGLTLSLMMLPNLVIATKQALTGVPSSVKDAAFSLGASNMQVIMHHSFPLALPGIMQGVILSIARILGESSPLIMIGMVAFIVDIPKNFLDPTTVLPVQIYMWASNPHIEFIQLAAIAIVALLLILLILNLIVTFIRKKFDYFIF